MTTIVTRAGKGSPLSNAEVDANFSGLNTDKLELGGTFSSGTANSLLFLNASKVASSGTSVGADVTFNGVTVGRGAGAVPTNTAVGNIALASNTTGIYNTAFGYRAANGVQTGAQNTAVGAFALDSNTGSDNTGLGYGALYSNTSGVRSTAVGRDALLSNTTASENVAIGYRSSYTSTTGATNASVGAYSLYSNTTGSGIVAVGYNALVNSTTGGANTALGFAALFSNTTASNNTAVGYQAGYSNTTGTQNIRLGGQAGYTNATGNYSTYLGYQSGYYATGDLNTFVGTASGYNVTTGVQNTFVGTSTVGAGYYMTTGSKNTILGGFSGNQGGLDIRTADGYIVLSDGDGNPRLISDGSGNWMAGRTTRQNNGKLEVLADVGAQAIVAQVQSNGNSLFQGFSSAGGGAVFQVTGNGAMAVNTVDLMQGQISFPATQSASSNANTLDDYEEGTWTPTVGGNATMGIQAGDYIKIGKLVWINFDFSVVTLGTGSNKLITGFPFTFNGGQSARTAGSVNYFVNLASTASAYYLQIDGNGIYLDLNNAAAANITDGPVWIQDGTRIMGTIVYQTSN